MSAPQTHAGRPPAPDAAALLRQVHLSRAAHLARQGSYSAAEALLSDVLTNERPSAGILDLLARIRAQQGSLLEAESLWRKVLQLDPANLGAKAGLEKIHRMHQRPIWLQPMLAGIAGLILLLCGMFILTGHAKRQGDANASLRREMQNVLAETQKEAQRQAIRQGALSQSTSNQMNALRQTFEHDLASAKDGLVQQVDLLRADAKRLAEQDGADSQSVSNQLAGLRLAIDREKTLSTEVERHRATAEKIQTDYHTLAASHERLQAQLSVPALPPKLSIALPGVKTWVSGNSVLVAFEEGLFDHGPRFSQGAEDRLLSVAKFLVQSPDRLHVEIFGYADDDCACPECTRESKSVLAMYRASAVLGYLVEHGTLSPENLSATIRKSDKNSIPSDSVQDRASNRTVILRVTLLTNH